MNKAVLAFFTILCLLLISSLMGLSFNIRRVKATGTIYIKADGSIEPLTANITSADNITYTFTDNNYDEIVVERSNIIVDGDGYTLQSNGSGMGFSISSVSNVTIKNTNIRNFYYGVYLTSTSHNLIIENNITANGRYPIYVDESSDIEISGNNVYSNNDPDSYVYGIYVDNSLDIEVSDNSVHSNDGHGIYVYHSSHSIISGNIVYSNSYRGISVGYCDNSTLFDNNMTGNTYNFYLFGDFASNHENSVDLTNTVDGKPVYYLRNITDAVYDGNNNGGIFYLVNCRNITMRHVTLANNGVGIYLWNTTDSNIKDLIISNSSEGIRLRGGSTNNVVSGITVASSKYAGIHLRNCHNNVISNNILSNNYGGMFIYHSNSNIVSGNLISNNENGISSGLSSSDNLFLHNNFVDNIYQCKAFYIDNSPNLWNNTIEGNYWSDYSGPDSNRDGIGDTTYVICTNNTDNHPLMGTFSDFNATSEYRVQTVCNSTISGFNYNGTAIFFNVSGETDTAGFCRICIPKALINETYRVFVNGTEILPAPSPLPCSNSTHNYIYFNYTQSTEEIVIIPEFPSFLILPLFMIATLLAVIVYRRKHTG